MTTAVTLNGTLYLDAQSDPNAVFIIKIDGALSTSTNSKVVMLNGGAACNVFWQINGAFNLGKNATFKGTALVNGAINLLKGSTLDGRALSKAGAVELDNHLLVGCDKNGVPLPIVLMSFYAKPFGVNVQLNWATATEINNDYFTVERSKDGKNFEKVTQVKGAGQSAIILNYSVVDYQSYIGTSYYRLKQTDFDGNNTFSDIIAAKSGKDFKFNIFPNPFQKGITIYLSDELSLVDVEIRVFDNLGKECLRMPLKQATTELNTLCFAPGIYMYQILNNSRIIQSGRLVSQQ
jgi:hypothetical protein